MLRIEAAGRGNTTRVIVRDREAADGGVSIHDPALFECGRLVVMPSGERWHLCWEVPGDHPRLLLVYTEKAAAEAAARHAGQKMPLVAARLSAAANEGGRANTAARIAALCVLAPLVGGLAGGVAAVATGMQDPPQKAAVAAATGPDPRGGPTLDALAQLLGDKIAFPRDGAAGPATGPTSRSEIAEAIRRAEQAFQIKAAQGTGIKGAEAGQTAEGPPGFTPLE